MANNSAPEMMIIQQNLGRCRNALYDLYAFMTQGNHLVALIQEPFTNPDNTISPQSPFTPIFIHSDNARPRAAIILSNKLTYILDRQHSTPDLTSVTLSLAKTRLHLI